MSDKYKPYGAGGSGRGDGMLPGQMQDARKVPGVNYAASFPVFGPMLFGDSSGDVTNQRMQTIAKAVGLLGDAQGVQYGQRQAALGGLDQMFQPMNDRLARLYGSGAQVKMPLGQSPTTAPVAKGPLDAMFSPEAQQQAAQQQASATKPKGAAAGFLQRRQR